MTAFDYTATARRPGYPALPPEVRAVIGGLLGGPPDEVRPAGGGFTPGFAATVRRGGTALFVKAACEADAFTYPAYRREAANHGVLPPGLPIPRLLASRSVDASGSGGAWTVLCLEHIEGTLPGGPWTPEQASSVHAALVAVDRGLRNVPAHAVSGSITDGITDDTTVMGVFGRCAGGDRPPSFLPALDEQQWLDLQSMVERAPSQVSGSSIIHNDLRPDNVIIERSSGRALVCDWNFLTRGPAWADWVGLLPYLRHDGLDADALLRASPLSAGVPGEAIDSWLALLAAYMVVNGLSPEVPSSPRLRAHGRFTAGIMVDWLSERRKWAA